MTNRAQAQRAFLIAAGWEDSTSTHVAGDASNRRYERLVNPSKETAILMDAPPAKGEDVAPFVYLAEHLTTQGFSAPLIYHADADQGFLLIEDLGDDLFARLMSADRTTVEPLYQAATDLLVALHKAPLPDVPLCDAQWLTEMTAPAFEWYAPSHDTAAQAQFAKLFYPMAKQLDATAHVVILRDFHAENLLWLPDRKGVAKVGLLDFQDALLGHPAYDLVSILQDARRDVDPSVEEQMIARYLLACGADPDAFRAAYALLGAQRNLRILGIFARLCLRDGKAHYVDMIPRVWEYVMRNLAHPQLADVASLVTETLPPPTPEFLEHLKSRCATMPTP